MDRFGLARLWVPILAVFLFTGPVFAQKAYTTDAQEIPLLTAPGKGKTILMVPPASTVEPLNTNSWVHVRYTKPNGEVREGWVQSKYLGARPPDSAVAKELGAENASLRERLDGVDREKTTLSEREKDLTDKLTKLNAAYEDLKAGSSNFLSSRPNTTPLKAASQAPRKIFRPSSRKMKTSNSRSACSGLRQALWFCFSDGLRVG